MFLGIMAKVIRRREDEETFLISLSQATAVKINRCNKLARKLTHRVVSGACRQCVNIAGRAFPAKPGTTHTAVSMVQM